jgi:hypothetical protein
MISELAVALVAGIFGLIPLIVQIFTTRAQRRDRMTRLTRIIHERLRRLPRGCAIDFVPDAPRPDVDELS